MAELPDDFPRFEALDWPLYDRQVELIDRATQQLGHAERRLAALRIEVEEAQARRTVAAVKRRQGRNTAANGSRSASDAIAGDDQLEQAERSVTNANGRHWTAVQNARVMLVGSAREGYQLALDAEAAATGSHRERLARDRVRLIAFADPRTAVAA